MGGPNAKRVMFSGPEATNVWPWTLPRPPVSRCSDWPWSCCVACVGCIAAARRRAGRRPDPAQRRPAGHVRRRLLGYGLLYLDGAVRLNGDTSITATDVFIGPDAQFDGCAEATTASMATRSRSTPRAASPSPPPSASRAPYGTNRVGGTLADPRRHASRSAARSTRPARSRRPARSHRLAGSRRDAEPARARCRHLGARRGRRLDRRRCHERRTARP